MTTPMTPEQKALQITGQMEQIIAIITTLVGAVAAADRYLNSYDTSAPSRIKAETRLAVEEAMALIRPS